MSQGLCINLLGSPASDSCTAKFLLAVLHTCYLSAHLTTPLTVLHLTHLRSDINPFQNLHFFFSGSNRLRGGTCIRKRGEKVLSLCNTHAVTWRWEETVEVALPLSLERIRRTLALPFHLFISCWFPPRSGCEQKRSSFTCASTGLLSPSMKKKSATRTYRLSERRARLYIHVRTIPTRHLDKTPNKVSIPPKSPLPLSRVGRSSGRSHRFRLL